MHRSVSPVPGDPWLGFADAPEVDNDARANPTPGVNDAARANQIDTPRKAPPPEQPAALLPEMLALPREDLLPETTPDSLELSAAANDPSIEPNGSEPSRETEPSDDNEETKKIVSLLSVIRANPAFGIRLATEQIHTGGMVLASTAMSFYMAEVGPGALGANELIASVLPFGLSLFAGVQADNGSLQQVMRLGLGIGSAGALLAIAAALAQNSFTIPGLVGAAMLEIVANQLYRTAMLKYLREEAGKDARAGLNRFNDVTGAGITLVAKWLGPPMLALGTAFPPTINLGTNVLSWATISLVPDTPPRRKLQNRKVPGKGSTSRSVKACTQSRMILCFDASTPTAVSPGSF
ncbi:hypothetical protein AB4305_28850 [Nocardia sp. 2YAB30]|uniref:hypothetical protein n=1 Tax=Nocardia sp. 2YAB30 TaxID=3233022 RepID=UPI003F957D25